MIVTTVFDIYDKVTVNDLGDYPGRITEIKVTQPPQLLYLVEYWWEGNIRTVWVMADEIKKCDCKTLISK
jgi:hypothetical protein